MSEIENNLPEQTADETAAPRRRRVSFAEDFRQFFIRGLAALMPTLITLWLIVWAWNFLWENVGRHIIWGIKWIWVETAGWSFIADRPPGYINRYWDERNLSTHLLGVSLAILLVYIVGVFVGNFIGRTAWRLAETAVMRVPLIRAIYPAVKQVTDFVLAERRAQGQFADSRVVAVQPHAQGIWSVGLVTGPGLRQLREAVGHDLITVFVPSTPTAFSGYVLVVPRESVIELPLSVEEAMRLLVTGGVLTPEEESTPRAPVVIAPLPSASPSPSAAELSLRSISPQDGV